jgi:hypothetical protein
LPTSARMARQGIVWALIELAAEGWMNLDDALELVAPSINGNARKIFPLSNYHGSVVLSSDETAKMEILK